MEWRSVGWWLSGIGSWLSKTWLLHGMNSLAWYELLSRSPKSPEVSSTFSRWQNAKPLANQKALKFMRRLDKIASHLPNDLKPGELGRMYRLSLSLTTELSRPLASANPYPTTYPDMKKLVSKLEAWEFKEKPRLKLEAVEIRDRLYDTKNPMLKLEDSAQSWKLNSPVDPRERNDGDQRAWELNSPVDPRGRSYGYPRDCNRGLRQARKKLCRPMRIPVQQML